MQKSIKIISFSDLVADVLIEIPTLPVEAAAHQVVKRINLEPGGASNFLIAGRRLGMSMSSLAVVGNDFYGSEMVRILKEEGIDVEEVIFQQQDGTTVVFVLQDQKKQHVFLGKYGVGPLQSLPASWKRKLEQADAIQFWGYSLLEERIVDAFFEAMQAAHKNQTLVSFDPGPMAAQASPQTIQKIINKCHILLMTEEEIPSMLADSTQIDDAQKLLDQGPEIICVKRGAEGCVIFSKNHKIEHAGYPVQVNDTAAAGDAFNAAFLFGYLQGWSLHQVASFANAMGAAKVQKYGSGRQVPTLQEVIRVLNDFSEPLPDFEG